MPLKMKLLIAALILTGVGAAGAKAYSEVYDSGYNAAKVEMQTAADKQAEKAVQKARADWERAAAAAAHQLEVETEIRQRNLDVSREIPAAVSTVAPECRDLGADVQRVFNKAIGATLADDDADPTEPESEVR